MRSAEERARIVRADNLRQKYGITPAEYDALREQQGYRCPICGTHESEIKLSGSGRPRRDGRPPAEAFRLVVDHCHGSSRVRGLLCGSCNSALGHFRDSVETLRGAIRYLEASEAACNEPEPARLSKLRLLDPERIRPPRTERFRGSVTVVVDGAEIHIPEGETRVECHPNVTKGVTDCQHSSG